MSALSKAWSLSRLGRNVDKEKAKELKAAFKAGWVARESLAHRQIAKITDGGLMVISAFRYCLGRKSYITGCCADWLVNIWPTVDCHTRVLIQKELEKAFTDADLGFELGDHCNTLGMQIDRAEWEKVRALWK